jgi:hypothetical protein
MLETVESIEMKTHRTTSIFHLLFLVGVSMFLAADAGIVATSAIPHSGWHVLWGIIGWSGIIFVCVSLAAMAMGMHKRPFRFTLRGLFVVMTLAALLLGAIAISMR